MSQPTICATSQHSPLLLQLGAEKKAQRRALGDAVQAGVIANETLAYFIGRTYLFMERIGINTDVRALGHPQFCNDVQHTLTAHGGSQAKANWCSFRKCACMLQLQSVRAFQFPCHAVVR